MRDAVALGRAADDERRLRQRAQDAHPFDDSFQAGVGELIVGRQCRNVGVPRTQHQDEATGGEARWQTARMDEIADRGERALQGTDESIADRFVGEDQKQEQRGRNQHPAESADPAAPSQVPSDQEQGQTERHRHQEVTDELFQPKPHALTKATAGEQQGTGRRDDAQGRAGERDAGAGGKILQSLSLVRLPALLVATGRYIAPAESSVLERRSGGLSVDLGLG